MSTSFQNNDRHQHLGPFLDFDRTLSPTEKNSLRVTADEIAVLYFTKTF